MANQEHRKILQQGVKVWNAWRKEHLDIGPDLSGYGQWLENFSGPTSMLLPSTGLSGLNQIHLHQKIVCPILKKACRYIMLCSSCLIVPKRSLKVRVVQQILLGIKLIGRSALREPSENVVLGAKITTCTERENEIGM